jgi:hypothetical protein
MSLFLLPIVIFATLETPTPDPIDAARAAAVRRLAPRVAPATALEHAIAARTHATKAISPELLLATAYFESTFRSRVVSRWVYRGKKRRAVTGVWKEPDAGERAVFRYCGFLQTKPFEDSLASCLELGEDISGSYQRGATELTKWIDYCRNTGWPPGRDRLMCAMAGYRGGWRAADAGGGDKVHARLELADRIRASVNRS